MDEWASGVGERGVLERRRDGASPTRAAGMTPNWIRTFLSHKNCVGQIAWGKRFQLELYAILLLSCHKDNARLIPSSIVSGTHLLSALAGRARADDASRWSCWFPPSDVGRRPLDSPLRRAPRRRTIGPRSSASQEAWSNILSDERLR